MNNQKLKTPFLCLFSAKYFRSNHFQLIIFTVTCSLQIAQLNSSGLLVQKS